MDKSATSTYAKIILSLCGFIVLGLIASDRQHATALRMRQELVERRFHAQEMLERINLLRKGDDLFLVNLCYTKLDGGGVVFGSGEDLSVMPMRPPQTGFLGNYNVVYGDPSRPSNTEFAKAVPSLVAEVKRVLATGNESEALRRELKGAITSELNKLSRDLPGPQIDEFVDAVLGSRGTVLSDEHVAWIVTGAVRHIDLDPESRDASKFGLGYVEEFGAVNDLPVFSAYEFVGLRPDDVYKRIKDYQTNIEKTLLSKTETENSVQVFGSGVSLGLSDLVIFAGPLIALFQVLYLIALHRQVGGKSGGSDKDPSSFSVPRFSSPADPLHRPWPSSPELSLERVLYSAFLIIPSAILLFGWLTRFRIDIFRVSIGCVCHGWAFAFEHNRFRKQRLFRTRPLRCCDWSILLRATSNGRGPRWTCKASMVSGRCRFAGLRCNCYRGTRSCRATEKGRILRRCSGLWYVCRMRIRLGNEA
jgi:hypothetical protein